MLNSCNKETENIIAEVTVPTIALAPTEATPESTNDTATHQAILWVSTMQEDNGLFQSSEYSNSVSLYDNALAILLFTAQNDFEKAERTLDYFDARVTKELEHEKGGFYQFRNKQGENARRTWLGDNAWLLIAINNYHHYAKNQKYEVMAAALTKWIISLQDSDGGLWGGYDTDGSRIHKITEGIITAFNAVKGYNTFHKNILEYLNINRWDASDNVLIAWPENPTYNYALDLHTLGYGILEDYNTNVLENAARYTTTQTATISLNTITGYCFDEDKDVIWLEGTAQMAVAFSTAKKTTESQMLLAEIEKSFISSNLNGNAKGIPYTTNHGTSYGAGILWDNADLTPALSATIWYIFAKQDFNPFTIQKSKNVPQEERFWLK
ncbi:hypothetical protein H0I25_19405 [Cellulophaga sp. HaHa_2_95]|uniref:hypothetical protein n=1 Tax=Cellulophaga sp. HaHa_2_95 TaxID=2745558 RepID=UPI001C4FB37E|nr:hypothetical protein [Cellulophaga sp. HaHa_2_95]QXP56187.1 hypothetical protein H0I25_19405 [Cellulophaga sp. HaHa_2_95]